MLRAMTMILAGGFSLVAAASAADAQSRHGRYGVPPGHMPSAGQCRVWLPRTPPGHQPPAMSCRRAQLIAHRYGGRVIYGGRDWRGDRWGNEHWRDDRWDGRRDRWRDRDDDDDDDRRRWRGRDDDD
jgi:hypothetical protein